MTERMNPLAERILSLLIFEENFIHITEELRDESEYALVDEIRNLIVKDLVKPGRNLTSNDGSGVMYDADHMREYSFRLSVKGLAYLEQYLKLK